MSSTLLVVVVVVILAIIFDFLNGFHDAANVVATMIASRSMSPEVALVIAATCEFVGPFLFGTAVAKTMGKGIVDANAITVWITCAALSGAIAWNLITWKWGIPSSSSHALVGGIVGAVGAGVGFDKLNMRGIGVIVAVLVTSPIIGLVIGFLFKKIVTFIFRGQGPRINFLFKRVQFISAAGLALSHGANDAQKSMGIITMVLVTFGYLNEFIVPTWVICACAAAIASGTAFGGWSIIKTVGTGIFRLRPIHALSSQMSSASVILGAALLGGPVSTTHVVSSSIMGVGAADRMKAVRWYKAFEIVTTWFVTIPAAAAVAAATYGALNLMRSIF